MNQKQVIIRDRVAGKYFVVQWPGETATPTFGHTYNPPDGDGLLSGTYVADTRSVAYIWGLDEEKPYYVWSDTATGTGGSSADEEVVP